jgi:two-component system, cell cycle sensor histidine kinase and response regulator CckA
MKADAERDLHNWAEEALSGRIALGRERVGIWEWDIPSGRVNCSSGFELIHFRIPGTFAGTYESLLDLVHPDDRERVATAVSSALERKSDYSIEYRVVLPDNSIGWIESRGRVDCDHDGRVQRMIGVCVDIGERRRTLELLRRSDLPFSSIAEAANDGAWLIDTKGRTLYVNWRLSLMLGYTSNEFLGHTLPQFCLPDDAQAAQEHIDAALRGISEQFDVRFRHKNGGEIAVFASMSPTRVAQGSIMGVLGLFWDITARKKAELALHQSEERFRHLVENLEDVFWVADPANEKMVYVSPAYDRLWGRSTEWLYQSYTEWTEAVHPDDFARLRAFFDLRAVHGHIDQEYRIRRPDGSVRWIRDRRFLVRNEVLKVDRVVGFAEDITERKNAELSLQLSEGKLRALLESASESIVAIDEHGKILLVNGRTDELFGYRREELIGQMVEVLLPEDVRGVHSRHRESYFAHPRSRAMGAGMVLAGRRKDGTTFPVEISLSFVHEGSSVLVLALISDITERKQLEERLRETAKFESLGVLAGGIAHDFNNLLTGIMGSASLVMEQVPAESSLRPLVEDVLRATERAAHLTNLMLAYSGRGRFVVQPVNFSEFTHETAKLLRGSLPPAVQLQLQLHAELPMVEADIAQLQQLIMNLVINGAEAIGDAPGVVTVRTGVRELAQEQISASWSDSGLVPGRYVFLKIKDTGCGMDESTKQRIFDPFFTTKFTGRGLGLAAVQGIVRGHKGAIEVESTPGQGSSFTILFPESLRQIRTAEPTEQHLTGMAGIGTVLVVDDEAMIRKMAQMILERVGYTVIVAEGGEQAISIFRKAADQISVVLLDMTMPVMDGEETLKQLREIRPDVPVLMSSGFGEIEVVERLQGQAIEGFVQKPYTAAHLVNRVNSIVAASSVPQRTS